MDVPMTRINLVPPGELHDRHLVAEYRELPRVFRLAADAAARGETPHDRRSPRSYVLGTGHVRFFYGRLGFLRDRHRALVAEMRRRGFRVSHPEPPPHADLLGDEWWRTWEPSEAEVAVNRGRIEERLRDMVG